MPLLFSNQVMPNSLWPNGLWHARLPRPLHYLLDFVQTHVHWVGDAIQPSHPLSSPSPLALNRSQHQGLFQWVISSHQVAKVLELQLQHQSFQWIFRVDWFPLRLTGCISVLSEGLSRVFSSSKASILWHSALFIHIHIQYVYMSLSHWSVEMAAQRVTSFV